MPFETLNINTQANKYLPKGVVVCFDKEYRYTMIEGRDLKELGYESEKVLGKKVDDVIPASVVPTVKKHFQAALNGEIRTFEMTASNGTTYFCTLYPLFDEHSEIVGGMMMGVNIKNVKKTESALETKLEELKDLNKKLKKEVSIRKNIEKNLKGYSEELKEKNLELEQFAYVASHDLQEPLRMIASFTQLLSNKYKGKLDENADEFIGFILEGAQRMQRLINDLLIYSRIGRKGQQMNKVELKRIIDLAKENMFVSLDETDAQIELMNEITVFGDEGQLVQLMQNLVSNAIKFRKENTLPVIKIHAENEGKHSKICVEDNGIGIDMKHKARIFNIFQRLHGQDKYPGTGIGLAICKKIVERHGGEIWVESVLGKGTTFCFTLNNQLIPIKENDD